MDSVRGRVPECAGRRLGSHSVCHSAARPELRGGCAPSVVGARAYGFGPIKDTATSEVVAVLDVVRPPQADFLHPNTISPLPQRPSRSSRRPHRRALHLPKARPAHETDGTERVRIEMFRRRSVHQRATWSIYRARRSQPAVHPDVFDPGSAHSRLVSSAISGSLRSRPRRRRRGSSTGRDTRDRLDLAPTPKTHSPCAYSLLKTGRDMIKMVAYAPERASALEAIKIAVDHGVVAAVGCQLRPDARCHLSWSPNLDDARSGPRPGRPESPAATRRTSWCSTPP